MGSNRGLLPKRIKTIHGHKRQGAASAEYQTWLRIKKRCSDLFYKDYANWGGRGIRVCGRWDESFAAFFADMGLRPSSKHSIDRWPNNAGDYEPGNCRWATCQEQADNKRTNIPVIVVGKRFETLASACRHFGVSPTVAHMRIQAGIAPDVAVSTAGRLKPRRSRESYWPKSRRG